VPSTIFAAYALHDDLAGDGSALSKYERFVQ
jgi:hypothetical protein